MIDINKYYDKDVLIIGGGTSTLDTKWENLSYDFVWTCNDFYLEPRVYNQIIDLYTLAHTTDLQSDLLLKKLYNSDTTVLYEPIHYRGKQKTKEFLEFQNKISKSIHSENLFVVNKKTSSAGFSGITFRLIAKALTLSFRTIYFVGFDGFNKDFSNIHAFTKHKGLKPSDMRRTYEGTRESYKTVFMESYKYFLNLPNFFRLQNLGEGFDYNIGTEISKEYFPLDKEIYDKIR